MYYYQRLRDVREDNDLSQKQVAEILGTTQQQYHLYETGQREIPVHLLKKLSEYYKVSTDYLIGIKKHK